MRYRCNACDISISKKDIAYGFLGTDPNNPAIDDMEYSVSGDKTDLICPYCGSNDIEILDIWE